MNLKTTEIYLHDLEVDRDATDIFGDITYKIMYGDSEDKEKGPTVLQ